MKLIVGLGNPGIEFNNTRHNIGFEALEILRVFFELPKFKLIKKLKAEISKGENIVMAKPQTFMNNSGEAVSLIKKYYRIRLSDIIIIHDDIDLTLGKIKISKGSSSAGNKGIESIINKLKSKNFIRIRIGIANELRNKIPADKFVLQKFNQRDRQFTSEIFIKTKDIIDLLSKNEPLEKIQNQFN